MTFNKDAGRWGHPTDSLEIILFFLTDFSRQISCSCFTTVSVIQLASPAMRHRDGFYFNVNLKGNNLLFLLTNVHLSCNIDLLAAPHPPLHLLNSRCAASGMGMCAFFLSAVSRLGRRNVPAGSNFCRLCGAARLADTSEGDMDAQRLCFNYLCEIGRAHV